MKTSCLFYEKNKSFDIPSLDSSLDNIALVFGPQESFYSELARSIKKQNPNCLIVGASSTQTFCDNIGSTDKMAVSYLSFEKTKIKSFILPNKSYDSSFETGQKLSSKLKEYSTSEYPLCGVMILSEGININGAGLVRPFEELNVPIFGGLASEKNLIFENTHVFYETAELPNHVLAIGLYGKNLKIESLNSSGLKPIGVYKKITKSFKNTLIQVDNMSAFDWYKSFLKDKNIEYANTLAYPIAIFKESGQMVGSVRTPISFDAESGTISFTGEIPEGYWLKLMLASPYNLISQAEEFVQNNNKKQIDFTIYFSCAARKMFLNHLIDLEFQQAKKCIGTYVYGEISSINENPSLLNQTLTLVNLTEVS